MPVQPPQVNENQEETIDLTAPQVGPQFQQENADTEAVRALKKRKQKLEEQRQRVQLSFYFLSAASIVCVGVLPFVFWILHARFQQKPVLLLPGLYLVIPIAILPGLRSSLRDMDNELEQVDFQIDLFSYEVSKRETRAEKLLRLNDIQLRRYYNLNLSQNRWVFLLGIACIGMGAAIIGVTMYIVQFSQQGDQAGKVITATLGGVGAILTNFVGAIYLNMNKSSSETLAAFHSRLVETHQLMLGSLLASRIDNDGKREDTLASLSLHLVPGKDAGKPAAAKPAARKQDRKRSQAKRQAGDKVADEGGDGGE